MKIYWDGMKKNIIGKNLRRLRTQRGMTQKKLAEMVQLEGPVVNDLVILRIESGQRFVSDFELKALAHVLNVPYSDLLD